MSKIGELALLLAETVAEKKSIYAGVPSRGDDPKEKQYLQLSGRILLVFMFMNLVNSSSAQVTLVQWISVTGNTATPYILLGYIRSSGNAAGHSTWITTGPLCSSWIQN